MDDTGLTDTRTTLTNGLMRLLIRTMPFHTEHHRLPDAHRTRRARLGVRQRGYARRPVGLVRRLRP
ncbi:hypothetical protein GOFOIKOB_4892 [Methylobacterium tardum]|uniref:Fatty acid desaturase n=1 Tax=Methylobacterium tardum TaxID=374432 RepID=A0AA37TMG6_9HYPH|nr:hypothetical protein [Methylobacterium tardum]URD35823.1 hypothetical protein M6G65_25760 [Methylobacterium tardum]GJE51828.1 hypothetical protein GOFOIKOB_4892 [Methylobacterium tardum]GLS72316.1 hypothetical protein GCM10007890_43290 [Methylobacterium tardum]